MSAADGARAPFWLTAAPVLLAAVWAFALAWHTRFDFAAGHYSYPKVDTIAFFTAARLAIDGRADEIYSYTVEKTEIEMERAVGVPTGAPRDITIIRVIPGAGFAEAAASLGYTDPTPPVFVYMPIFAWLFAPVLTLPWPRGTLLFDWAMLFPMGVGIALYVGTLTAARDARARIACMVLALLLSACIFPMSFSLFCGQVTPLVCGVALLCLHDLRSRPLHALLGIAAGVIAAMKLLPVLLLVYFLVTKRRVQTWAMGATLIVLLLASRLVGGVEVEREWLALTRDITSGVRLWSYNQSIDALLHRFVYSIEFTQDLNAFSPQPLRSVAVLIRVALLAAWVAVALRFRGWRRLHSGDARGAHGLLAAMLLLFMLLPPLSWLHYALFAIPAVVCLLIEPLAATTRGRMGVRVAALVVYTVLALDVNRVRELYPWLRDALGEGAGSVVLRLLTGMPAIATVALFGLLCALLWRTFSSESSPGEPSLEPTP